MQPLTAIDLFAGGGGFTTAACQAGIKVLWAANHYAPAVACHKANHPDVPMDNANLREYDFTRLPNFDILIASPCCQGFSRARGKDSAAHDASRATCFSVVDAMIAKRPRAIVIENVEEIRSWGARGTWDGSHYKAWLGFFTREGYHITETVINAADAGVPQERPRLFITMIHDSVQNKPHPIPQPHFSHVGADSFLDWSAPMTPVVGHCERTLEKVAYSKRRLGETFLLSYYGNTVLGRPITEPLGVVTVKSRWALIHRGNMRMLSPAELRAAMGFPSWYALPKNQAVATHLLGNAVCPPAAAWVLREATMPLTAA